MRNRSGTGRQPPLDDGFVDHRSQLSRIVSTGRANSKEGNAGRLEGTRDEMVTAFAGNLAMRAVVKFDGEKYLGRFAVAQDEVEMMPGNHVTEAGVPVGVIAGNEIRQSDLEGDDDPPRDGPAKCQVEK